MKNRWKILLVSLCLVLGLTACSTRIDHANPSLETEPTLSQEDELLEQIEATQDPKAYVELADLYRDEGKYSHEEDILRSGLANHSGSRELKLRLAEQNLFAGDRSMARIYLYQALEEKFDEDILAKLFKNHIDYGEITSVESYYDDYHDRINKLKTKILAYEAMAFGNSSHMDELRQELLGSGDLAAYESLLRVSYRKRDFDDMNDILSELSSLDGAQDLINLYSTLASLEEEYHVIASKIGHFIDATKKDLAIAYKKDYRDMEIHLALFDPNQNKFIYNGVLEEPYPDFLDLNAFHDGEKDLLAITRYMGMSATSGINLDFYEFAGDQLIKVEGLPAGDLKLHLLDDFKIEIKSEELKRTYIIDIPNENRPAYVRDGQYDADGKTIEKYPFSIIDGFFINSYENYGDMVEVDLGFGGTLEYSAERLASVKLLYDRIDGKFELVHFVVDTDLGYTTSYFSEDNFFTITKELMEDPQEDESTAESMKFYPGGLLDNDFILVKGDQSIDVNDDITRIIEVLGEGNIEYLEQVDEYAHLYRYDKDGLHILYIEYSSPDEEKRFNTQVSVTTPEFATTRGLRTGQGIDRLEELYGLHEPFYEEEDLVIYSYNEEEDNYYMDLYVVVDPSTNRILELYFSGNL